MKTKRFLAFILTIAVIIVMTNFNLIAEASVSKTLKDIYIPLWMQPDTVIIYDENVNYTIIKGGELSEDEIAGREDIAVIGLINTEPGFIAEPNTKIEYDKYGFHQNTYYLWPGAKNDYRLSPPSLKRNGTGYLAMNTTTGNYGLYMNHDTKQNQYNNLSRLSNNTITGTGKITYYYGVTGDQSNALKKYDCATRKYDCDVPGGTAVTATNKYTSPNKSQTYYKWDCGGLSSAILDIWCGTSSGNTSNQAIRDISTNGDLENVYSGHITLTIKP